MLAKKIFISLFIFCVCFTFCKAENANPQDYPKVIAFAREKAEENAVDNGLSIRFSKVQRFSISNVQNGIQYHMIFEYLTRDGFYHFYTITVYENPAWDNELSIMDLEHNSRLLEIKAVFLP